MEEGDTMRFIETLLAVLNQQEEIPDLPSNQLTVIDQRGTRVSAQLSCKHILQIARLQTLAFRASKSGELPTHTDITAQARETGGQYLNLAASLLTVQEDATRRVMMLEGLIIEIVRQIVPAESERFDVRYFVNEQRHLLWIPSPPRRFLD